MARTGRFGSLPGRAPDITYTITQLLEQYEQMRDRNIYNAWMEGGLFEGKKVTDERLLEHYRERRNSYTKDDPEWDYWDQQYEQVEYGIGESKMLLKFANGDLNEAGASRWYSQNARRFPRNSEAWREAMRNAASFRKAAQEQSTASNAISKSEQYQQAIDRIERESVQPALLAIEAFERMLQGTGYNKSGGFLAFNESDMAFADERLNSFVFTAEGAQIRREWMNQTGEEFSLNGLKRMIDKANNATKRQAAIARRFGYQSYVPSFRDRGKQLGQYARVLSVFGSDIYDEHYFGQRKYQSDMQQADTPEERMEVRAEWALTLGSLQMRAQREGAYDISGRFRSERLAITTGEVVGSEATAPLNEAGAMDAPTGDVEVDQATVSNSSALEYESMMLAGDLEELQGLASGTHVRVIDPESGRFTTIKSEEVATSRGIEPVDYGIEVQPVPAKTYKVGDKTVSIPAHAMKILSPKTNVYLNIGGQMVGLPATTWVNTSGVRLYEYAPKGMSQTVVTTVAPFEWPDDADPETPYGVVYDSSQNVWKDIVGDEGVRPLGTGGAVGYVVNVDPDALSIGYINSGNQTGASWVAQLGGGVYKDPDTGLEDADGLTSESILAGNLMGPSRERIYEPYMDPSAARQAAVDAVLPPIVSGASASADRTGILSAYSGNYASRMRLAKMTPSERKQLFDSIVELNGWDDNPYMKSQITYEMDTIIGFGQGGQSEMDYWESRGEKGYISELMESNVRLNRLRETARVPVMNKTRQEIINDFRANGFSDEEIRAQRPDLFTGREDEPVAPAYNPLPGTMPAASRMVGPSSPIWPGATGTRGTTTFMPNENRMTPTQVNLRTAESKGMRTRLFPRQTMDKLRGYPEMRAPSTVFPTTPAAAIPGTRSSSLVGYNDPQFGGPRPTVPVGTNVLLGYGPQSAFNVQPLPTAPINNFTPAAAIPGTRSSGLVGYGPQFGGPAPYPMGTNVLPSFNTQPLPPPPPPPPAQSGGGLTRMR